MRTPQVDRIPRPDRDTVARVQSEAARRLSTGGTVNYAEEAESDLETEVRRVVDEERLSDPLAAEELVRSVLAQMAGVGWLQPFLEDPDIENVRFIGAGPVFVDFADGRKERHNPVVERDSELVDLVRVLAARHGRRFGVATPIVHLRLPDGSRLSASMGVSNRPHVTLRRHRLVRVTLDDLVRLGTLSADLARFLNAAVLARRNIIVSGAMNAGKTTLLRALCAAIPPEESLYLVELVGELGLERMPDSHPECVLYEERDVNTEGAGAVTMARLVEQSVRFNMDRVLVGEVLGAEVLPMLRAMSSGREGSMATLHASSSADTFSRLVTYALMAPEKLNDITTNLLMAQTIHFVVHIESVRTPRRQRFVTSVREVTGVGEDYRHVNSVQIWKPGPEGRAVPGEGLRASTVALLGEFGWRPPTDWLGQNGPSGNGSRR